MAAPLAATSASSARDSDQTRLADCLYSRDEATCRCPARSPSNELSVELLRWFGWPRAWVVGVRTMASPLRNGERAAAAAGRGDNRAARRLGALLLLLRVAALCFSVAAAVFAATSADGVVLRLSAAFRFLLAANAIVAAYSAFEVVSAAWEVARATTLLPEAMQLWFDFGHDQGFGYMALAAAAVAARETAACSGRSSTACLQEDIAVGLGLAAFVFLALAALASGYRLVRFLAIGSPHTASSSSLY